MIFGPADTVVDFAVKNRLVLRGHNLLWYFSTQDGGDLGPLEPLQLDRVARNRSGMEKKYPTLLRKDGLPPRPLPFDVDLGPTPAFAAMAASFAKAPPRGMSDKMFLGRPLR